jgi:hypothetical protein
MLTMSSCSPSASSSRAEPEEERTGPSAAAAVTIAVAGTAPQAGETPPPATGTPRQAVRMKRAIKKKSVLYVCLWLHSKYFDLSTYVLTNFDFISAASVADLQLTPASTTPALGSSTREESASAGPVTATSAPDPSAPERSAPAEPAPGADTMLPDLPPPELRQAEVGVGGEKQFEAPSTAPTDGAGERLTAPASYRDPHAVC